VRGRIRADRVLAGDGETNQRVAVVEFDARNRADLDTRDSHVIADGQSTRLGEEGLVPECGGPGDQLLGRKTHCDDEDD
jgi:hypothetical protein